MFVQLRRALVLCLVLVPLSAFAFPDWQQPTADELTMKSYAADPNAPAVVLFNEETLDENLHTHIYYSRIKILTEKGKEMYGDIEIPYQATIFRVDDLSARTIHSDGSVVPFTGKPYDKLVEKSSGLRVMAKVISLPDVQVGSILEFRFKLHTDYFSAPEWRIQQRVPVMSAHYHFTPSALMLDGGEFKLIRTDQGHQNTVDQLLYAAVLPAGDKVVEDSRMQYDLAVKNVPALPSEDYLPPTRSLSYRVIFYLSAFRTPAEFWKTEGKYWSTDFNRFANPSSKIRDAVKEMVAPGDTDEQKEQKIYAAVMKLENTSFTREHSTEENKAEGLKVKTADDILAQQRGDSNEITRLFVAMSRAAGLKSYGAIVVNRDENLFEENYLSWDQLDDELAIVEINGKEMFFDPGQRYCEFGKLHWKHTWAGGVRQTSDGTQIFSAPSPNYHDNDLQRDAQLTLDPDGQVHGLIQESMTGAQALRWRQAALRGDEAAAKKDFDDDLQSSMPAGVLVKTNHFVGLTDFTRPLTAIVNVSGALGTQTGKRVIVPAVFFEAGSAPLFVEAQRENPVYMHYPYTVHDQFQLTLPPNVSIESLPQQAYVPFSPNGDYVAKFVSQGNIFAYGRQIRIANVVYLPPDYPALRAFFQSVSSSDRAQVALKLTPTTEASTSHN